VNRLAVSLALLLLPLAAAADERILSYHSDILVRADAVIEVTETITVRAEGDRIRRGIYRDFPTRYRDRSGNRVVVDYEPESLLRDGRPEAWRIERRGNGVRSYFGQASVFLDPGEYTYTWRYDASRMLGFFDDYDELYWNVTGSGWDFPIDRAGATVRFGFEVASADIGVDAWTGAEGSRAQDVEARVAGGEARFETTAPLGRREGLTVAVSWPKGLVAPPTTGQKFRWLVRDNRDLLFALAGLALLLFYYVPVWMHFGRDPAPGVLFTRYQPPRDLSPASLRYVRRMGYDGKVFTAAVVNLAVKGHLRIEIAGGDYSLVRTEPPPDAPPLAKGERELLAELFAAGDVLPLDDEHYRTFSAARAAHQRSLRSDYRNRLFRTNGILNLPAVLVFLATLVVVFGGAEGAPPALVFIVLIVMVAAMALFAWLMKRPTGMGRRVLDEIEGFREYLEIAEKDELNMRNPPEKTPELFERFLPFALALGVEQAWAERFAGMFARLQAEEGSPYHPSWYNGSWTGIDISAHTSRLSSGLNSAISSSMTAPGSSSGSGGGGSSGGGGGGGGGGGW